jgi:hypothetical protein
MSAAYTYRMRLIRALRHGPPAAYEALLDHERDHRLSIEDIQAAYQLAFPGQDPLALAPVGYRPTPKLRHPWGQPSA